jgi:hypothetical protein
MWKEAIMARYLPGETGENHQTRVRIAGVPVEIGTRQFPNTTQR